LAGILVVVWQGILDLLSIYQEIQNVQQCQLRAKTITNNTKATANRRVKNITSDLSIDLVLINHLKE